MITTEECKRALECARKRGKLSELHTHDVWVSDIMAEVAELNVATANELHHIPQLTEWEEELADVIITCMSMAAFHHVDMGKVIEAKMKFNEERED